MFSAFLWCVVSSWAAVSVTLSMVPTSRKLVKQLVLVLIFLLWQLMNIFDAQWIVNKMLSGSYIWSDWCWDLSHLSSSWGHFRTSLSIMNHLNAIKTFCHYLYLLMSSHLLKYLQCVCKWSRFYSKILQYSNGLVTWEKFVHCPDVSHTLLCSLHYLYV